MASSPENLPAFGPFRLDLTRKILYRDDKPLKLRPAVFSVLKCFYEHRNKLITHRELTDCAWGSGNDVQEKTRTQTVKELRDALEPYGALIETRPALGYVFNVAQFSPHPEAADVRWMHVLLSFE